MAGVVSYLSRTFLMLCGYSVLRSEKLCHIRKTRTGATSGRVFSRRLNRQQRETPDAVKLNLEPKRRSVLIGFRVMWSWIRGSVEEEIGGSDYRIRTGDISRAPSEISIPGNSSSEISCGT